MPTALAAGIYPPLPTFFNAQDELDLATLQQHMLRLADSSIAGYVLMGSNGEAVHLSDDERVQVTLAAREILTATENALPLVVGCGTQSTRTTLNYCRQAARAGADFALILPPSYYRGRMNKAALLAHYLTIAEHSPLPILIYNMPASTAGLDLDADTINTLAEHANIVGVKDSGGNIAKIAQIVASTPPTFHVFAGSADFLLPALVAGAIGAVAALANIVPRSVCQVQTLFHEQRFEEARIHQARIIPANAAVTTVYGVPGLKAALAYVAGYGGQPRSPLQPLTTSEQKQLLEILTTLPREA